MPESEVCILSPAEVGGFRSEEYLAISPQGKVPALQCQSTGLKLAESDTVSRYLLTTYPTDGPSFQPDNPKSNMIARFHDVYLTPIQNCLYKSAPPFGPFGIRKDALAEYSKQLYAIADLMDNDNSDSTTYMCGNEVSLADATVFPSIVFASHMFPKFDAGIENPIPPKIESWYQRMIATDAAFNKVYGEASSPKQIRGTVVL